MTLTHELLIDYREALYEGLGLDPDDEASDGVLSPVALRGQILGWQWRAERLESELDATRAAMLRLCEAVAAEHASIHHRFETVEHLRAYQAMIAAEQAAREVLG